jgi:predicted FMN-binding regulatory protein PaiB
MKDGKLVTIEVEKYKAAEETPFLFVETEKDLRVLKSHLEEDRVLEIAIDLEAHTMRSY